MESTSLLHAYNLLVKVIHNKQAQFKGVATLKVKKLKLKYKYSIICQIWIQPQKLALIQMHFLS